MGTTILIGIILVAVGLILGWTIRWLYARFQLSASEQRAERVLQEAKKEAEAQKKDILLEAKEQLIRERNQQERENRERRNDLQRSERRLAQKEDVLDKRLETVEKQEKQLVEREAALNERDKNLSGEEERYRERLEEISGLTQAQARDLIISSLEAEAKHDAQALINKIEEEAHLVAEKKARDILVTTIQRLATDTTSDITVSTVSLPSDEMKGRIIGREGRNIRALETLTGVDIIIDDTPEAVVISCFDPVRKEIARIALERLILDGRIHPARIEEIVQKVTREISQKIYEEGEKVLFDLGIHDMSQEGVRALGRLYFRTSYGQNVLYHSKEVAVLAGMIAAEVGADVEIAKRGALLHDIGKGVETDSDKNHAEIGMEIARKINEDPRVVNAVGSHHNDIEPSCVEALLVQIADAISAARPGARRETMDNYVKRLENLEAIAEGFPGVEKAYAIQAGRELRVLVNNEKIPDQDVKVLGRDIAKKIENDLKYPGRIRVTLIRETRIIEYAR
ncbi:ribonuclease Y [Treponema phagedenis]|uniref:Ribonuclease Y n=1 Tax=Treponema phagedenis TaxID=162 RepID=A0A0B7GVG2_TREPH|nr:ribonuclease Y [Treponema phagedenis]EFW36569.1 YmdA/YtgF family protein [Treponema phagedenis F0421]NVP23342.1 ribonuclease Y [Treponema phagedenis]QEJ95558.1 ribonuclease Y [Treponema phagedenis]QEJ98451.1 ribonuclease Y [Treponema phagedenis]QEK01411.1 ribonuclease Y [Treponema phagedenis]